MSYGSGVQRPASGLRGAAGAALAALRVLIAVGVRALMLNASAGWSSDGPGVPRRQPAESVWPGREPGCSSTVIER
jgi:hypothetical protein